MVLTAKLYDYLATGRPIMALVNGPGDRELQTLVEDTLAGRVFAGGHAPTQWLKGGYQQWKLGKGRLSWSVDLDRLSAYVEAQQIGKPKTLRVKDAL